MTYTITQNGISFTVRSEAEAMRYAALGAEVVEIVPKVLKDGRLQTLEEANSLTGSDSTGITPNTSTRSIYDQND